MAQELAYVKRHGHHSDDYKTHDHLNKQTPVPVEDDLMEKWKNRFTEIEDNFKKRGERIVWAIVDGFLLYWEPEVYKPMDVKLFLRVPEKTLKDRRDVRDGYITAEGGMWKDPPGYFEQIVYPAYVKAHQEVFEDGDVENGQLSRKKVSDLILLDGIALNMTEIVEKTCESIEEAVKAIEASV
ncbi:ribosylnicotinamide kinase [Tulasnella sp. 418]|nr:ribosylnicotinamide kinase [Tulasnella sp. 418]